MTRKRTSPATATMVPLPPPPVLVSNELEHVKDIRPLSDLVLMPGTLREVQRFLAERSAADRLAKHWLRANNRMLFRGPPGNGKTATAGAIAHALGYHLVVVRLHEITNQYMGESAKALNRAFEFARSNGCVVLVDECDAIVAPRSSLKGEGGAAAEAMRTVNSFLVGLENARTFPAIIICATNMSDNLDPAVFRRFDQIIDFPEPGDAERRKLFGMLMDRHGMGEYKLVAAPYEIHGSLADVERMATDAIKSSIINGTDIRSAVIHEVDRRRGLGVQK